MNNKQRKQRKRYRSYILMLAAVMTISSSVTAFANTGNPQSAGTAAVQVAGAETALGRVNLSSGSYFELRNVLLHPEQNNKTALFTVRIYNGGTADLKFVDYWVRMRTQDGRRISVQTLPQDKDKNIVTPKSSIDITFYGTVNEATELKDLIFDFIQWDFNQPNYERTIGSLKVPANYTMVTPASGSRIIDIAGNSIKAQIKKRIMSKNEKNYTPTVTLNLENVGIRGTELPENYRYMIRTTEGYMYPLEIKGVKKVSLQPKVDKDVELTGTVPVSVSPDNWQLVIVENSADLKLNLPVASFTLPAVATPDSVDTGKEYTFTNDDGTYAAKLNYLQRLPWEDQDILTGSVTLINNGEESLPLPELFGHFMLDDAIKVEAMLIKSDNVIGLAKGKSVNYKFLAKIPYTYDFSEVKLVLKEKTTTGETSTESELAEFVHRSELMNIATLDIGAAHKIENIGRTSEYRVRKTSTYTGWSSDTFSVQLEATNLEKRIADTTKLVANFEAADGSIYKANITEIKNKISPGGKALLLVTADIPKNVDKKDMKLVIGEAVTGDKQSGNEGTPDAYINAVAFWLPEESHVLEQSLKNIDLAPYTFSMSKIASRLDSEGLKLTFNYELTKDSLLESNVEGRKIVIEVVDENETIKASKEYEFKEFDQPHHPNDNNADTAQLRVGSHTEFKHYVKDPALVFNLKSLKDNYNLNIYESINGHRKLLATQSIRWFSTTD